MRRIAHLRRLTFTPPLLRELCIVCSLLVWSLIVSTQLFMSTNSSLSICSSLYVCVCVRIAERLNKLSRQQGSKSETHADLFGTYLPLHSSASPSSPLHLPCFRLPGL